MSNTIYATFTNQHDAERAAGALMDHGVDATDVSFIVPEGLEPARSAYAGADIPTPPQGGTLANAPASTPATIPPPDDIPAPDVPVISAGKPYSVAADINPHPVYEPDDVRTEPGYTYDALGAVISDRGAMRIKTPAGEVISGTPSTPTLPADAPIDAVEHEPRPHIVDINREEPAAASGITTTTGADAAKGALEGGGIGIGLGILLGLAAVAIPGVGWVAGTGALVAGLAAATGAAGAVAGGVYGYLSDMGLPPAAARQLSDNLAAGGPLLSVTVTGAVEEGEIIRLLKKYGATSAQEF